MSKRRAGSGLTDWDDLRYFLALAETGSQAAAAKALRTNQSTVCRRLRGLERQFDASLFDRHHRGLRLTPVGLQLMEQARQMDAAANEIDRRVVGFDRLLRGTVRIAATDGLGGWWLTRRLVEFRNEYPGITVEMLLGDAIADLGRREADIAIRLVDPEEPRLVAKRVGTMRFALFASADYLATFGTPAAWDDLTRHRVVDLKHYIRCRQWQELLHEHPGITFRGDSSSAYANAVRHGMGIGLLPTYTRRLLPDLVRLDIAVDYRQPIWLVSHPETNRNARVRAVLDFLYRAFAEDKLGWFPDRVGA